MKIKTIFVLFFAIFSVNSIAGSFNITRGGTSLKFGDVISTDTRGFSICIGSSQGACDVSKLSFDFNTVYPSFVSFLESGGEASNRSLPFKLKFKNPHDQFWAPLSVNFEVDQNRVVTKLFDFKISAPIWNLPISIKGKDLNQVNLVGFRLAIDTYSFNVYFDRTYHIRIKTFDNNYSEKFIKDLIVNVSKYDTANLMTPSRIKIFIKDGKVMLSWDKPPTGNNQIAGYQVLAKHIDNLYTTSFNVKANSFSSEQCIFKYAGCKRIETELDFIPGEYLVWVKYFYSNGVFEYILEKMFVKIPTDLTPPNDVTNFNSELFSTGIRLSWTDPANQDCRNTILKRSNDNKNWITLEPYIKCDPYEYHSYDDLNLTGGQSYYYKIHTCDSSGNCTNTKYTDIKIPIQKEDLVEEKPVTSKNETDNQTQEKSGCFIATAAYGSYMEPDVLILRTWRDEVLLTNALGRKFVSLYYKYSPPIANVIAKDDNLKALTRVALLPLIFYVKDPKKASLFIFLLIFIFLIKKSIIKKFK